MPTRTPASELCDDDDFYPPSWSMLVDSLGHEVLAVDHGGQYQGDSAFTLCDESGRVGFLVFGWGSCSGCDSLAACTSVEEVAHLQGRLAADIVWSDSPESFATWARNRDWGLQFCDFSVFALRVADDLAGATTESLPVAAALRRDDEVSLADAVAAANSVLAHRS